MSRLGCCVVQGQFSVTFVLGVWWTTVISKCKWLGPCSGLFCSQFLDRQAASTEQLFCLPGPVGSNHCCRHLCKFQFLRALSTSRELQISCPCRCKHRFSAGSDFGTPTHTPAAPLARELRGTCLCSVGCRRLPRSTCHRCNPSLRQGSVACCHYFDSERVS